jgi:catechol 2,3-dioxygenase-like lactoylglutathione lyase family enzyme
MTDVRAVELDHLVLNVRDAKASVAWYRDRLGLQPLRLEEFERGEVFFPSVRIHEGTIIDLLETPPTGRNVDHFCVVLEPGTDLDAVKASGEFDVVEGPVTRWGARGDATSLYVRDPDGHQVELRVY